ncbi:MAG: AAA family ATPase [Eggerthellaceae bacterium]|jgi:predicted AAA+ superfamily ATPase|nr:AAA family ATPase [Eggerthellaceae bacterium]
MDRLYETMQRLLANTVSPFHRYTYDRINWDNRMLGLVGPRGVGKTTLFLQHIKESGQTDKALFASADNLYFAEHTLLETAEEFYKNGGIFLYLDEVHKYDGWSRELKAIYDSFPDMHVYFTGSSILDIERGESDLSRRAPKYTMQGLSFREFLAMRYAIELPPLSLDDILAHKAAIPGIDHPLPYFKEYLACGYYPFGQDPDFPLELTQVVNRTLEVDIPQYANMNASTGRRLRKLIALVSTLAPFKPSMAKLASQVGVSRNNLEDYLLFIEKAGMIAQLRESSSGLNALGKVEKVYLDNTNLLYSLSDEAPNKGTVRETFFFNQMRVNHSVASSSFSDFSIGARTFEVGGRSKGKTQLQGAAEGYVVKDDLEYGHGNVIPLWAFGLNY